MSVPRDYDVNPRRFALGSRSPAARALYVRLAERLRPFARVLDVGCGDGNLRAESPQVVGLDGSMTMLRAHPAPRVLGEAAALPFRDGSFDAVTAVNMLYHLADPLLAIREARRVLRPGGLFVAVTPSRADSPELAGVWRPAATTFDAEEAPALVGEVFERVEVESWDAPLVTLGDRAAVRDYLVARFVGPADAEERASRVRTPLTLTKRGAYVYGSS
ncbi:class I SAM-dependent methyltransferase [Nonomuraea sp. NPDC050394]|uniref:class I SAM-dependent methyltransferase n=1 Tax=Nonomuraea sp. NPDC050394 TaxID=3364363 RepID=UPI0037970D00